MTGPKDLRLPRGLRVRLDRRVRVIDDGAVLVGGAPPRLVTLAPAGRRLLADGGFTVTDRISENLARRLLDAGLAHPDVSGVARSYGPGPRPPATDRAAGGAGSGDAQGRRAWPGTPWIPSRAVGDPDSHCRTPRLAGSNGPTRAVEHPDSRGRTARLAGDVTVVVPVKDRTDGLARLLAALTDTGAPGAVVVVDDGSADPGAVRAVAEAAGARVLRHDVARGPAAARNTGAAAARTPLVAFLDSDVVPQPGWLDVLRAHLADPAVALAAPRIVALEPVRGTLGRYEAVRSSLDLGPDAALIVPRSRVAYVPSAALLVRREALAGSGFDERLRVAEDVDLVLRLHAAGWRLRYDPAARVAHDHRTTPWAWWTRKAFYGTGAAPLAVRHPGSVPPMVLTPWSAAVAALLLTARPRAALAAVVVGAVNAERLARRLGAAPLVGGRGAGPLPSAADPAPAPRPGAVEPPTAPPHAVPRPLRRPRATAALLVALGAAGAVRQTVDAITRHHWPLAVLACAVSRRARRTVAAVALAEGVLDWWRCDRHHRPPPAAHVVARRLDDLAYGAGLWWGALRLRTAAPLLPAWAGRGSRVGPVGTRFAPVRHRRDGPPMTEHGRQDEHAEPVPDAPGMPETHPPEGGPDADPGMPDPEDAMAPRPGALEGEETGDVKPN